jgi:hypothetical protein
MSFSPIPAELETDLGRAQARILELGAGDGRFTSLLRRHAPQVVTLDMQSFSKPDIVGDVRALPLQPAGWHCLIAANLLKHLVGPARDFSVVQYWLSCLKRGGCLWILEDEPKGSDPAQRNYRDLQALMARLSPASRGPLLDRMALQTVVDRAPWPVAGMRHGRRHNDYPIDNIDHVLDMLSSLSTDRGSEAQRIAARIRRHGLSYGDYWWTRLERN